MFDLLIRGAKVVDGSGNPWFYGDVALAGERVSAVTASGVISTERAKAALEAGGKVLAPGFIDIQSHSIAPLMVDGRSLSKLLQGVTTEIMGEAWTPAPFLEGMQDPIGFSVYAERLGGWVERARSWRRFGDWLTDMVREGVSPNVGSFLGGGTLRQLGLGMAMRAPTPDELSRMERFMAEAMEDGAFGPSYALIYPPDAYTDTDELVTVCRVAAKHHGVYITHLRSEADDIFRALEEALEIGRRAGVPVEVYHLKAAGRRNWDKMEEVIARIARARADGLDVTADMYPYPASGTGLSAILPPWASADGKLFDNLRDPEARARIKAEILAPKGDWEAMASEDGPEIVMPVGFQLLHNRPLAGLRLSEIAARRNQHWVDAAMDLILEENQRVATIYHSMSEENVKLQLQQPWIKISTDAGGLDPAWARDFGPTHPRAYGTYPRVLGKYVREEGVLGLEDAVRKMTSAVADRLNLRGRGLVRAGMYADLVLFDPATITDRATFENPHQLSEGVSDVWVNGVRVIEDGAHTGARPGRFVRPG